MPTQVQQDICLKDRNTFHIDIKARYWAESGSHEDLAFCYRHGAGLRITVSNTMVEKTARKKAAAARCSEIAGR